MVSKQSIITAIDNSQIFLKVQELKEGEFKRNSNGQLYFFTGGFNMVFQVKKNLTVWAFRVSHVIMPDLFERYQLISTYLKNNPLPYFAGFIIDREGLLVNGNLLDTVRMEWLEGELLKEFIENNLYDKTTIIDIANKFRIMCSKLRSNEISHGDLQEGNILITPNREIKLIDYDSICIPSLEGRREIVTGLKGYQHPSRFNGGAMSLKADYFSELIIYLSLIVLSKKPSLWLKYQIKDTQYLLFSELDFENFEDTSIYKDIIGLSDEIDSLIFILKQYLNEANYKNLNPFECYINDPEFLYLHVDYPYIVKGMKCNVSWEVKNAIDVEIIGIGKYTCQDSVALEPTSDVTYTIKVKGLVKSIEKQINIKLLPISIDTDFTIPIPGNFIKEIDLSVFHQDISQESLNFKHEKISFEESPTIQITKKNYLKTLHKRLYHPLVTYYHGLREKFKNQVTN